MTEIVNSTNLTTEDKDISTQNATLKKSIDTL